MFQESDGEGEVDDFSDASYYLRDRLLPLTPDNATNLSNSQLAKSVQDLLDDQIDSLAKSVRMRKFLTEQKDVLPCAHENSVHTRRVLEILLTRLQISGKVCEKQGREVVTFQIVKGICPPRTFDRQSSRQSSLLSQLSFQQDMLEVNIP